MVVRKSQVDFYVDLCVQLIGDDPLSTTSLRSLRRDVETVRSRVASEGLSFVTKTLPKLGKALDLALETFRFTMPREFCSQKHRSRPAFLQAYFNLIFNEDGSLLEEPDVGAIKHLRQVLYFGYKLEIPHSPLDEHKVIENFVSVERDLESQRDVSLTPEIIRLCQIISRKVLGDFNPLEIVPRHGPGAVATGEKLNAKWVFTHKYLALHRYFPYYRFMVVGGTCELIDRLGWYKSMEVHESGTAKVVLVPKDSRGPRLISCEPLEYQWIQQGLGRKLAHHLERNFLTRGVVNFTHQEINQQLALAGSTSRSFATIDLKDASDRVSLELVRRVFQDSPNFVRALEASRTTATLLPDGRVIGLHKFAPMGSALCFPVEAFVFWLLMVAAIVHDRRLPLERVGSRIFVYGDDIVVPNDWGPKCMEVLESAGLVVNRSKSYISGFFRESCGVDAFKGINVTPLRLRKQWTGRHSDGSALASYVSLANALFSKGYIGTSTLIKERVERTYGKLPYGVSRSSFPCWETKDIGQAELLNRAFLRMRFRQDFQRLEFKVLKLSVRRAKSPLDGWPRLLRDIISPPFGDPIRVVVPRSTIIKRGWAPVA